MVQSTFITLVVVDLLLLSHSFIFTLTNYAGERERYLESNSLLASTIPFFLLMPLMWMQLAWLVSCLLAVISLKLLLPYLIVPYLLSSGLTLSTLVWLIVRIAGALVRDEALQWPTVLLLCSANLVFLEQAYFAYIKIATFNMLIRKRRLVSTTERGCSVLGVAANKVNMSAVVEHDTYSTKSTVIVTDEYLNRRLS